MRERPKALILDGTQRSALAATRALGKKGIHVVVGGEQRRTLAGSSRYCAETLVYSPPGRDSNGFIDTIAEEVRRRNISVLLPMTEITTSEILSQRNRFKNVGIPFASFQAFERLADKWEVLQIARDLGVPIPKTHFIGDLDELKAMLKFLEYPSVLKPSRSRVWCEGRWHEGSVRYANTPKELWETVTGDHCLAHHPFLVQNLVQGQGHGVFALYQNGRPVVFFAHRRLRERPPTGGVSVLSESVEMNPQALSAAEKILRRVGWHGVAMVEFKVSDDGTPYLMEINPRFWGSLQLAIDAGVDFAWLAYQMAAGDPLNPPNDYKVGVRNRWLVGDMAHLYRSYFPNRTRPSLSRPHKRTSLAGFFDFFDSNQRFEINRWDDMKPFLFELMQLSLR